MSTGSLDNLLGDLYGGQMPAQGGFGSPTMQGYGFNWYGGQPQMPEGGYYNQMAQNMSGPSYAPKGSNFYSGGGYGGGGGKGMTPQTQGPTGGGKGMTPSGSPGPGAPVSSGGIAGGIFPSGGLVGNITQAMGNSGMGQIASPAPHVDPAMLVTPQTQAQAQQAAPQINPTIGGGGAWLRALRGGQLR